jgi:hypothetical protein
MLAIPYQGVDVSVCDPEVCALWVRSSEAIGIHPDAELPGGFLPKENQAGTNGKFSVRRSEVSNTTSK